MGDFRREGFGRQSMSEKRKGHIDPNRSEFYQRVKSQREKGLLRILRVSFSMIIWVSRGIFMCIEPVNYHFYSIQYTYIHL